MNTNEGVIKAINQTYSNNGMYNRSAKITSTIYFEGDYTSTALAAETFANSSDKYHLLINNCVQKTLAAFMASDIRFGLVSYGDYRDIIPNLVYTKVAFLPRKKTDFPWALCASNLLAS